jgi:hypothetical protein
MFVVRGPLAIGVVLNTSKVQHFMTYLTSNFIEECLKVLFISFYKFFSVINVGIRGQSEVF